MARRRYTAKYGDTWNSIAEQYQVPVNYLVSRNNLTSPVAGSVVTIPAYNMAPQPVQYPTTPIAGVTQPTQPTPQPSQGIPNTPSWNRTPPAQPTGVTPFEQQFPNWSPAYQYTPASGAVAPTATTPTGTAPVQQVTTPYWDLPSPVDPVTGQWSEVRYKAYADAKASYEAQRAADRANPASPYFKPQYTAYMDYTGEYPYKEGRVRPRLMTPEEREATENPDNKVKYQFANKRQYIDWLIATYGTKQLASQYNIDEKNLTSAKLKEKLSKRIRGWPGRTAYGKRATGTGERPAPPEEEGEGPPRSVYTPGPERDRGSSQSLGGGGTRSTRPIYRGAQMPRAYPTQTTRSGNFYNPAYIGGINWRKR